MKTIKIIFTLLALTVGTITVQAQSLYWAKLYVEQGKYKDALGELKPLTDKGNPEALCLLAQLYFEGKGVDQNTELGIKYASMAAVNDNADAKKLLDKYNGGKIMNFGSDATTSNEKSVAKDDGKVYDVVEVMPDFPGGPMG